jgi:hypothetical protein
LVHLRNIYWDLVLHLRNITVSCFSSV